MNRLLRADMYRMYCNKRFLLCAASMVGMAVMFIIMQYTAMDYVVALDRVIFLPMSFYGVIIAALISLFIGDDFSDGVIRNKLVAGRSRSSVHLSNLITGWTACIVIYMLMIVVTVGIGSRIFENNVTAIELFEYFILGLLTCLAFGSIFSMLSMLICNKSTAVMICMGLTFVLLGLCLHTNQILVQEEYKNGVLNPHFVSGIRRNIYEILHDINPIGQAAQLSVMNYFNPIRWIVCDLVWIFTSVVAGTTLFKKKDIR